jgi:hypothetical protein
MRDVRPRCGIFSHIRFGAGGVTVLLAASALRGLPVLACTPRMRSLLVAVELRGEVLHGFLMTNRVETGTPRRRRRRRRRGMSQWRESNGKVWSRTVGGLAGGVPIRLVHCRIGTARQARHTSRSAADSLQRFNTRSPSPPILLEACLLS